MHERMLAYRKDHPKLDLRRDLHFLLETFPQRNGEGRLRYLLDGPIVFFLNQPEIDQPGSIDLLTSHDILIREFAHVEGFQTTKVEDWLKNRDLNHNRDAKELLLQTYTIVRWEERLIHVLHPVAVAAGILLSQPEMEDQRFPGVSQEEIDAFIKKFQRRWQSLDY